MRVLYGRVQYLTLLFWVTIYKQYGYRDLEKRGKDSLSIFRTAVRIFRLFLSFASCC